jgi:hypothetical protein
MRRLLILVSGTLMLVAVLSAAPRTVLVEYFGNTN